MVDKAKATEIDIEDDEEDDEALPVDDKKPAIDPPAEGEGELVEFEEEEGEDKRLTTEEQVEDSDDRVTRRKNERRDRRKRQQAAKRESDARIERQDQEIAELRAQVNNTARKVSDQDLQQIRTRASTLQATIDDAKSLMAEAISKQDGEAHGKALDIRDEALLELNDIKRWAADYDRRQKEQAKAPAKATPLPHAVARHVDKFKQDHPWWDQTGADEDSRIVIEIDKKVNRLGLDNTSDEYWAEVRKRVKRALPERFEDDDDDDEPAPQPKRRAPPTGNGRSNAGNPARKQVMVTPERRKAMEEAGIWDDPKKRNEQLRYYAKYDQDHKDAR